jgi:hypothetical protein
MLILELCYIAETESAPLTGKHLCHIVAMHRFMEEQDLEALVEFL